MRNSIAWSVIDERGQIDLCCVHDTRRGALVNWLHLRAGVPMKDWMDDAIIDEIWHQCKSTFRVATVQVVEVIDGTSSSEAQN